MENLLISKHPGVNILANGSILVLTACFDARHLLAKHVRFDVIPFLVMEIEKVDPRMSLHGMMRPQPINLEFNARVLEVATWSADRMLP